MSDVGRPTDFKESYIEQAFKLCLLGAIDKDLADFFGCSESTLNNWKIEFPEFMESIKGGKTKADMEIASSLYNKAKGMTIKAEKAFKVKTGQYTEEIKTVTVNEGVPPDTVAIKFWLMNRQSDKWKEKQEIKATNINLNTELDDKERKEALKRVKDGLRELNDYEN